MNYPKGDTTNTCYFPACLTTEQLTHTAFDLVWRWCLPDGAHLGELVDRLVAVVDVLPEEVGELLEAEDLERAVGRDLADGRGQEAVDVVAVARLHEDRRV